MLVIIFIIVYYLITFNIFSIQNSNLLLISNKINKKNYLSDQFYHLMSKKKQAKIADCLKFSLRICGKFILNSKT